MQHERLDHGLPVITERVLHQREKRLHRKLAPDADVFCNGRLARDMPGRPSFQHRGHVSQCRATAGNFEVSPEQGLLGYTRQGRGDFLLFLGRGRAYIQHVDLHLRLLGALFSGSWVLARNLRRQHRC